MIPGLPVDECPVKHVLDELFGNYGNQFTFNRTQTLAAPKIGKARKSGVEILILIQIVHIGNADADG